MQIDTVQRFFSQFLQNDEKITIRFLRDKDKTGTPADATAGKYGTIKELLPQIGKINKSEWGAYFVVNHTGSTGTNDADVQSARALFIDIDDARCPDFFPCQPSVILRRSDGGGYHVYWFLSGVETDLKKWSAAQKTLIHFYKSDKSIHNPARLMRIPGTINHKEKLDAPVYEIQDARSNRYTVDEVVLVHTDKEARRKQARKNISFLFKKKKISDGDGRHKAFVQIAFILNDYGFTGDEAKAELLAANKKYLKDPYTPEELEQFLTSQKYAKNTLGEKSVTAALELQQKIDTVKDLLSEWYYVRQQDLFFQDGSPLPVTSVGFNAKFSYLFGVANPVRFTFQYDCIKQYESLVYDPAEDTDIKVKSGIDRNMYEPPNVTLSDKKPDWFLKHIEYLITNEEEREHFLNYLAYLVQNPGKKVMHGILLIGKQGIGKSILQRVFSQIFGESNVCAPHNENLSGNFTGWAKHCQIVVINELMQVDKKDFNNKIKPFITEPTVEIREMYKAPYTIKNCMNIIAFSNHDNALYIEKHDRRWFIVKSEATKKTPEYYNKLIECIDNKCGEVLHFLQTREIKNFHPGAEPLLTTAKKEIIEYSTSDLESWIAEAIESGAGACEADLITINDLRDNLPRQLQNGYATINRISKILRDYGGIALPDRVRVGGELKRFWIIRNHGKYDTMQKAQGALSEIYGKIGEEKGGFVQ